MIEGTDYSLIVISAIHANKNDNKDMSIDIRNQTLNLCEFIAKQTISN